MINVHDKMKLFTTYKLLLISAGVIILSSCFKDPDSPGYEYVPDMYRSQAIEAYVDYGLVSDEEHEDLKTKISARIPVDNTIPYHKNIEMAEVFMPYNFGPGEDERIRAAIEIGDSIPEHYTKDGKTIDANVNEGKRLYGIFCVHCHGEKGNGDGGVITTGGFPSTPPAYNTLKDRNLGSIFHTITYGKNAMGAHGSQLNKDERWKLAMYVRTKINEEFFAKSISDNISEDEKKSGKGEGIFAFSGCVACHQVNQTTVGPSIKEMALAYKDKSDKLRSFLKEESDAIMLPELYAAMQPNLAITKEMSDEDLNLLIEYIMTEK